MKWSLVVLLSLSFVVACGGRSAAPPTGTGEKVMGPIVMQERPDIRDGAAAENVLNECLDLQDKLAAFTLSYGEERGLNIQQAPQVTKQTQGNALVVEITQLYSGGNAMLGHRKSATVELELYTNGVLVDSTSFNRVSGGGMYGGFKSSCAVLGRTMKALGSDITVWLQRYSGS